MHLDRRPASILASLGLFLILGLTLTAAEPSVAQSPASSASGEAPLFAVSSVPPPGFRHLVEPETSLVDVFLGGRFIVSTLATFTQERITFADVTDLVEALPPLTDPSLVATLLALPLGTHTDRLCLGNRGSDCGTLSPGQFGVIFDPARFRVDLFLNPELLARQVPVQERFLPAVDRNLTLLQNFGATVAGSDDGESSETFASFTTVAWGENRAVAVASYTDTDDLTVDRLFAQRDYRGAEYLSGIFRTSGRALTFLGENDLGGVRIASSLRTRTDLGFAQGTPINVFLAAGGRVDILKDGRLLSSDFYPAGNQVLDTSRLPDGAYDITVRVNDGGARREETRFFSKTARIPPLDQPLTSFEMGRVLDRTTGDLLPETTDTWLARLGHSRRVTERFGLDAGIAATEDEQLFEAGLFHLGTALSGLGYYELQASSFIDSESDSGFATNGQLHLGRYYVGYDYRRVYKDDDATPFATGEFRLIPEEVSQRVINAQGPLFGGMLSLFASRNRRSEGDDVDSRGLSYSRVMSRGVRHTIRVTADVSETDGDWTALVGFSVNVRGHRWSGDLTPRYRYDESFGGDEHGYQLDGYASWHRPEFFSGDLRLGANGSSNDDIDTYGVTLDYDHRLARSRLSVSRQEIGDSTQTSWAGNVVTSVLTNGDAVSFGAQNAANAAILVSLEGDRSGAEFDVLVDGQPRGYAPAGRVTPIHLAPFRTYEVRIRPRKHDFVSFEDKAHRVTLYPGNVVNVSWDVADVLVAFGRAMNHNGQPIANARIEGVLGIGRTDEHGYFQVEVRASDEPLRLMFAVGDERCTVFAHDYERRRDLAILDNLTCRMRRVVAPAESDGRDRQDKRIRIQSGRNS